MLFKFNALMRRDYKDDYSPYSFSFDMSQDISQYPDIIGNISHGMYTVFEPLMIMLKRIAEMKRIDVGDDDEYDDDDYGFPLHFKSCSLEVEDGIEKLGLHYINDDHQHLTLKCNDNSIKICYNLITASDDESARINAGVIARIKCPNICDYIANQLVFFAMTNRNFIGTEAQTDYLDTLYDDKLVKSLSEEYSKGLSIVLRMSKKYDVILLNCRNSGDIEDDSTFEWLEDKLHQYADLYKFKNRFTELNFIYDDDFGASCGYFMESSPTARSKMIGELQNLHDLIINGNANEEIIANPIEISTADCETSDDIKDKIKDALKEQGLDSLFDTDSIAQQIADVKEQTKNDKKGGVFFGSIGASSDGEVSAPEGFRLTAEDINYFINELSNTDKPHTLIKATIDKIKETYPSMKEIPDFVIVNILKEAILDNADPEILTNLDNFKPDKEDE